MSDLKLNFAAWNLNGVTLMKRTCPSIVRKIKRILPRKELNFIFFQEIPNPAKICLAAGQKNPFPELEAKADEWHSCRDSENPRGILLFQKTAVDGLTVTPIKGIDGQKPPVWTGYTFQQGEKTLFNFFGFWNIPEQGSYWDAFVNFLNVIPQDSPCIIAGDTNICIQSRGSASAGFTAAECEEKKVQLETEILAPRHLVLMESSGEEPFTWFNRKSDAHSDFRCDLLIVSESLKEHIKDFHTGTMADFIENDGSDHLPIFFTYCQNPEE